MDKIMKSIIDKYKQMSVQARASIWFVVCSLLQKGISFITVPIFTRLMTTEQYGTYSVYLSWLQILTIITSLYLYFGVFNNAMVKFENDRDRYISSMQGLTIVLDVLFFLLFLVFKRSWSEVLGLAPIIIALMFLEMLVTPALSFWSSRQRFEFRYKRLVAITMVKTVANPLLGLIAVVCFTDKSLARIASIVVVEVLVCAPIMVMQFCKGKCFFDKVYWKFALGMAIPLVPHYLSGTILSQGDRVMIDKFVGKSEVAFYSVAYSIGMLVQIFTNAINNSFTPWVYQKIKARDYQGIEKTINMLLILIAAISIGIMMFSPELIMVFGSDEYASAVYVIPPVAASVFFIFLYNVLAIPQFYFEKTKFLMLSSVIAAVVNVCLNYIFIREYGYIAAGYTTLVCYVLYSIGHFIVSKKVTTQYLPGKKMYDTKFIAAIGTAMIFIGILCNFLFDYWYIRYGILLVGFIAVILKKDVIIGLVKNVKQKNE